MAILLLFAFLAGVVTILSPCMWPMLPIVLSTTIQGIDHRRPLGIALGIITSFAVFTLSVSYLIRIFHFDPNIVRTLAIIVIIFLGAVLLFPKLNDWVDSLTSRLLNNVGPLNKRHKNDFKSGFLTGLVVGIVWSPCGGPILASIAALAATGMVNLEVILITAAFSLGIGIPLFLFTYGGQQIVNKTRFFSRYTRRIQLVFGVIMIITAIGIYYHYDQIIQLKILNALPTVGQGLDSFEQSSLVSKQLDSLQGKLSTDTTNTGDEFNADYAAPDLSGGTKWLNSPTPLTLKSLKGKVVLVDFWTYTCINCIRTLPFVTSWYDKYKDQGFVVIGVHTPEFAFEKETSNVQQAINQDNIHYPVVQDNNYAIWNNFSNQYWPAEYLIDANGNVRRTEFGEGHYDLMEKAIQDLLKENGQKVIANIDTLKDQTPQNLISPETYLGSARMEYFYPTGSVGNGTQTFTLSPNLAENSFSYGGQWTIYDDHATASQSATLNYHFAASKVFIIMRPDASIPTVTPKVKVMLDGKPLPPADAGTDDPNGTITVTNDRLYSIIDLHGKTQEHTLQLEFENSGIQAYTFTFG